jgi:hypothetical protein
LAFTNRNETNQLDLLHYKRGESTPEKINHYTDTVVVGKYSYLDMNIFPVSDGTYWTRIDGGIPITDFVKPSGEKVSTEGIVRVVSDHGVYLERFEKGDHQIEPKDWIYWQSNGTIKVVAKPPENSLLFVSGVDLFSQTEAEYYKYNQNLNKWLLWKPTNGEKEVLLVRGSNGLYRIRKDY